MQLQGSIGGQSIIILIDSGSSNSFLSSTVAAQLSGVRRLHSPILVQVADGGSVTCTHELPMAEWSVQGYTFHSTLRVLQLGSYDMIVGMDWLMAFSPMKIHWQQKWMMFQYGATQILLQGIVPNTDICSVVQLCHIASDTSAADHLPLHPAVQSLLDEFADVFAEPSGLPPR
jgi:hypothetical protein